MRFKKYTSEMVLEECHEYLFVVEAPVGNVPVHGTVLAGEPAFYDYTSNREEDIIGYLKIEMEWEE